MAPTVREYGALFFAPAIAERTELLLVSVLVLLLFLAHNSPVVSDGASPFIEHRLCSPICAGSLYSLAAIVAVVLLLPIHTVNEHTDGGQPKRATGDGRVNGAQLPVQYTPVNG